MARYLHDVGRAELLGRLTFGLFAFVHCGW